MREFLDLDVPFFLPLWRRVAVVVICLGWAGWEFSSGAPGWGLLFAAAGLYCGWALLVAFDAGKARARQVEKRKEGGK
ncbi:hypothetical protein SAMN05216257_102473 [Meinhardsimonia xiamenensis]|jgi:hypothetical protein|uniref:DUF3329 domain-containing protein n=1 Tax=Meinhardsimonia xiamenensis TaxID=990712 RepID=A0A1G9BAN3_9RHOB|nr:hypothetical protein [Meinhardsimonia xiamenensis]PRX35052.1 hypothetical protein LV81_01646 [Meinhardsimonia xiamenensis]SDK36567.1 hypothetical protein SAMN05216257_102473 [Meinhardsimonia xiamenensis]